VREDLGHEPVHVRRADVPVLQEPAIELAAAD
jgi:hypothetical protein